MQRYFKEPVPAYGWRTDAVRQLAARLRREMAAAGDETLLFAVAEKFFASPTLEEKSLAVFLLQRSVGRLGDAEFRRLEGWLSQVTNWAVCDALTGYLLGPMIAAEPRRSRRVFRWAKSKSIWHRRAAAAALIPAARQGLCSAEVFRLADQLLREDNEMVQKAVGWLLKEACKKQEATVVRFLLRVRPRAPRLVLRTACEKLPARDRRRILS